VLTIGEIGQQQGNSRMETSKKIEWTVSKKQWQEEAISDHLTCCLCGTELSFEHRVDHVQQVVKEEAHCKSCGVKHRTTENRLQ
jgi:transcription elongation factor Elf1